MKYIDILHIGQTDQESEGRQGTFLSRTENMLTEEMHSADEWEEKKVW